MKNQFLDEITGSSYSADEGTQFNYLVSIIRSILQYCSYASIEYWYKHYTEVDNGDLSFTRQLLSPADGSFVSVLDRILPEIRNRLWPNCADPWFKRTIDKQDGEEVLIEPLVNRVNEWVSFRNNRLGHGVVDMETVISSLGWLQDLARDIVLGMADLIPVQVPNSEKLKLVTPDGDFVLETLKQVGTKPIVIRDIRNRGSSWRVRYQTLDIQKSVEGFYEIDQKSPFIKACLTDTSLYTCYHIPINGVSWRPSVLLPQRQTTVFYGRLEQLSQLWNWYNDLDSHACLVYGEGGIGKTTLVLEFLNDLIDTPTDRIQWFPTVICYYSAKQTRWGPGGLEYIRGISPVIEDSIRLLVSVLEDRIDRSWHSSEAKALIDKAATLFRDVGLQRDDILLVLDNTETLTRSSNQEEDLAILFRQLSSKLGRLLMTSRRYERVEARPIKVPEMNEDTGKALLKRLGDVYNSQPIQQAGDARLKKITRQLSGRPLLLDVFARYSSYAGRSLEESINLVLRDTRKDLGEFLFEDAWQRIQEQQRCVFVTLGQFGSVVNGRIIGWVCEEFGVPHDLWLDDFDETIFGSLVDYGSEYDVHFDVSTREFLAKQYGKLPVSEQRRITRIVSTTNQRYRQYLAAQDSEITDRVAEAFRTSAAKAAKLASKKGDIEGAVLWYEEAISVDPVNPALWDRYAWFLRVMVRDLDKAQQCAHEAIRLDPDEAEYLYTAGTISAALGLIDETDRYMIQARDLGKPVYLCLNQRAIARIEASAKSDCANWREYLAEADNFVTEAMNVEIDNRGYATKNQHFCRKLRKRSNDIRLLKVMGRVDSFN